MYANSLLTMYVLLLKQCVSVRLKHCLLDNRLNTRDYAAGVDTYKSTFSEIRINSIPLTSLNVNTGRSITIDPSVSSLRTTSSRMTAKVSDTGPAYVLSLTRHLLYSDLDDSGRFEA